MANKKSLKLPNYVRNGIKYLYNHNKIYGELKIQ